MRQLDLKVPPLAVCATALVAIVAFGYFVPSANQPFPGHRLAAISLVLAGVTVAVTAILQFRRVRTTVNPMRPSRTASIVATGVFSWSRNPMYLGMAMCLLGVSAWFSTVLGYALVPLFCVYITEFQIKPEERALMVRFGAEYSAYAATVRRWI
jgi:protein-S-isoprenylcysteine O-methyltransferase Ste14